MLDWKLQGIHAWYYLAEDKGYFAQEKLAVTIDQGDGSAATVTKVMAGAYQAGFGDVNAIIQNAAPSRASAPVMVYMLYNRAPYRADREVVQPDQDAEGPRRPHARHAGRRCGGAHVPGDRGKGGVDAAKVKWTNVAPNLQEQLLLKDHVDGVGGVLGDQLHEPGGAGRRPRQGHPLVPLRRPRRRAATATA